MFAIEATAIKREFVVLDDKNPEAPDRIILQGRREYQTLACN